MTKATTTKNPHRMCFACRERSPKRDLIRLVRDRDGSLRPDLLSRGPGRGAYVHADEACLKNLAKRTRRMRRQFDLGDLFQRMNHQLSWDLRDAKRRHWLGANGSFDATNRITLRIEKTHRWLNQLGQCEHTLVTVRNDSA